MKESLHYLLMANQMLVQRQLLDRLKNTGLTIGQPKVLDYLTDHDGSSQKEIAKLFSGGRITDLNSKPYGEEGPD